jgi:hypothetical protein
MSVRNDGLPFPEIFKNMIRSNLICNFPVKPNDINKAVNIFGSKVSTLKVKTIHNTQ